jgi:hypothetical protein
MQEVSAEALERHTAALLRPIKERLLNEVLIHVGFQIFPHGRSVADIEIWNPSFTDPGKVFHVSCESKLPNSPGPSRHLVARNTSRRMRLPGEPQEFLLCKDDLLEIWVCSMPFKLILGYSDLKWAQDGQAPRNWARQVGAHGWQELPIGSPALLFHYGRLYERIVSELSADIERPATPEWSEIMTSVCGLHWRFSGFVCQALGLWRQVGY